MYKPVSYPPRVCLWCKEEFTPNRRDKQFCNQMCYKKYGKKYKGYSNGNSVNINRNRYLSKYPYKKHRGLSCEICGFLPEHPCQLDVDHIDGDHSNNEESNLQTLCANCHRLKTAIQLGWHKYESPSSQ